jgi:hypothetical protein
MADTVVHEHVGTGGDSGAGTGIILAVIILLVLAMVFVFGIPFMRGAATNSSPQVNIPDKVDVNVQGGGAK